MQTSPYWSAKYLNLGGENCETPWKWTLTIFKYKTEYHKKCSKNRWKNGIICQISFFASWVMVLKLPKIVHFCKFVLTSPRYLNLLKQFISIHLKDLIIFSQKVVFFIGVRATVHGILENKISQKSTYSTETWQNSSTSNTNIFETLKS